MLERKKGRARRQINRIDAEFPWINIVKRFESMDMKVHSFIIYEPQHQRKTNIVSSSVLCLQQVVYIFGSGARYGDGYGYDMRCGRV